MVEFIYLHRFERLRLKYACMRVCVCVHDAHAGEHAIAFSRPVRVPSGALFAFQHFSTHSVCGCVCCPPQKKQNRQRNRHAVRPLPSIYIVVHTWGKKYSPNGVAHPHARTMGQIVEHVERAYNTKLEQHNTCHVVMTHYQHRTFSRRVCVVWWMLNP